MFAVVGIAKNVGDLGDLVEAREVFRAKGVEEFGWGLFGSAMTTAFGKKTEQTRVKMIGGWELGALGFGDRERHTSASIKPGDKAEGEDEEEEGNVAIDDARDHHHRGFEVGGEVALGGAIERNHVGIPDEVE